jgi:tRNA-specific 2-thiouridylase
MQLRRPRHPRPLLTVSSRAFARATIDDLHDARVAAKPIPHYIVNFEREFADTVIANFVAALSGRTPIPCVHCNGDLKFATLASRADGLGSDFVATGHYARVDLDPATARYVLRRATDPAKDQSYFLFTLTQDQLAHAMFPVGALDKATVRDTARDLGLPVADKPDSHEICFVASGEHASFLEARGTSARGGAIRDVGGRTVGKHEGVHRFTVGQRKGLGLSSRLPSRRLDRRRRSNGYGWAEGLARPQPAAASRVNWIVGQLRRRRARHRAHPPSPSGGFGDVVLPDEDRVRVTSTPPDCHRAKPVSSYKPGHSRRRWGD